MIIEGDVPLDDLEREGPYGESLGNQGAGEMAFWMNVTTVTHRRDPGCTIVLPASTAGR